MVNKEKASLDDHRLIKSLLSAGMYAEKAGLEG